MTVAQTSAATQPRYLAFIPISCGSSWAENEDKAKAVAEAKRIARRDWGVKHIQSVAVYDITGKTGWYATTEGMFCCDDQPLKPLEIVKD